MKIKSAKQRLNEDVLLVPFAQGKGPAVKIDHPAIDDFKGGESTTHLLYLDGKRVILVGLGEEPSDHAYRRAFAAGMRAAIRVEAKSIAVALPAAKWFTAVLDGLFSANDTFDDLRAKKVPLVKEATLLKATPAQVKSAKQHFKLYEAIYWTRRLICRNADDLVPSKLAGEAKKLAKHPKVKVTLFNKERIEKEKMGLLLAVGRGAKHPPAFIIAEYKGDPRSKEHTVLVGKGVTYDTGGLYIKPHGFMDTMKSDMSGAATVLGVIDAVARLGLKVNVTAVVPTAENAIGSDAFKPMDVYRSYSGKTVQIAHTDAEGRLLLADALSYAAKNLKPTRMVDLATLTGACVIALGEQVAGMMSDHDQVAKGLERASKVSGDRLWRLPLVHEYWKDMKSDIADFKNSGQRYGSSITAALFLQQFVEEVPWAHLDIAGVAFAKKPTALAPSQATGYGIKLLVEWLRS